MNEVRPRIESFVLANPGLHFNALGRELDLAPGQLQYHIHCLLRDGVIVETRLYGRTHYFPPSFDPWERGAIALLRRETARDVLLYLVQHGPSVPADVAADLGIARSTLEWHATRLVEQDLVEKRLSPGSKVTFVLTRPTETIRLLQVVEPSLPDRFIDRFMRLIDTLLAE